MNFFYFKWNEEDLVSKNKKKSTMKHDVYPSRWVEMWYLFFGNLQQMPSHKYVQGFHLIERDLQQTTHTKVPIVYSYNLHFSLCLSLIVLFQHVN